MASIVAPLQRQIQYLRGVKVTAEWTVQSVTVNGGTRLDTLSSLLMLIVGEGGVVPHRLLTHHKYRGTPSVIIHLAQAVRL